MFAPCVALDAMFVPTKVREGRACRHVMISGFRHNWARALHLPRGTAAEAMTARAENRSSMEPQTPTILLVEDDGAFREAVRDLLLDSGFVVITAEHGEQALHILRQRRDIRAIILDVSMPVMNGGTFRGQQLADPAIASIPLIIVSGREDCTVLSKTLEASACLQKPVSGQALLKAVSIYR
jgi:CheY-like chemotaxis protein